MKKLRLRFLVGLDGMDGARARAGFELVLSVFFAFSYFSIESVFVFLKKRGASLNLFVS